MPFYRCSQPLSRNEHAIFQFEWSLYLLALMTWRIIFLEYCKKKNKQIPKQKNKKNKKKTKKTKQNKTKKQNKKKTKKQSKKRIKRNFISASLPLKSLDESFCS